MRRSRKESVLFLYAFFGENEKNVEKGENTVEKKKEMEMPACRRACGYAGRANTE
jgi:hypothetical protein